MTLIYEKLKKNRSSNAGKLNMKPIQFRYLPELESADGTEIYYKVSYTTIYKYPKESLISPFNADVNFKGYYTKNQKIYQRKKVKVDQNENFYIIYFKKKKVSMTLKDYYKKIGLKSIPEDSVIF